MINIHSPRGRMQIGFVVCRSLCAVQLFFDFFFVLRIARSRSSTRHCVPFFRCGPAFTTHGERDEFARAHAHCGAHVAVVLVLLVVFGLFISPDNSRTSPSCVFVVLLIVRQTQCNDDGDADEQQRQRRR